MGDSFAALSQQQWPAKRDACAANLAPSAKRVKKPRTCVNGSDSDSEDDVSTLLNSSADQNDLQEIESGTTLPTNMQDSCKSEGEDELFVTGRISPIYEKYNLMEVLHIFPMIFKMKPIFGLT